MVERRDETRQRERMSNKYAVKKAASERLAAERAAQQRAERRRNILVAGGAALAVIAVIAVIVVIGVANKSSDSGSDTGSGNPVVPAPAAVADAISDVSATDDSLNFNKLVTTPPVAITGDPLTGRGGLPQVLYIGAEYCPYCAATRWPLAVALGRFGTFDNLKTTYSADNDVSPHTPTLSFHGSSYQSQYIDFVGVENADGAGRQLEPLTDQQSALFQQLNTNHYPLIDFGGKWAQKGSSFDPNDLKGMTPEDVAKTIGDTSTDTGKTIQAGADVFTAIICELTGGQPSNVCTAPGVKAADTALNGAGK